MSSAVEPLAGQRTGDLASGAPAPTPTVAVQEGTAKPEPSWGAWVVIAGLVAVVAIFVVAVLHYKTAAEVTTAVGAVSGVIAALVGAYFGIRGATLAQTKVESSSAAREERSGR